MRLYPPLQSGFENQMPAMVDAYMAWEEELSDTGLDSALPAATPAGCGGVFKIQVVNVFHKSSL